MTASRKYIKFLFEFAVRGHPKQDGKYEFQDWLPVTFEMMMTMRMRMEMDVAMTVLDWLGMKTSGNYISYF